MPPRTYPANYPICRHIKTNGQRCQSPAVHRATYCHFHRTLNDAHTKGFPPPSALGYMTTAQIKTLLDAGEPLSEIAKAFPTPYHFALQPLEDAESVQVAISLLFSDMVSGRLCTERARPLLYALQLASYNFRTVALVQAREPADHTMAHRVVRSRDGHTLAAPELAAPEPSSSQPVIMSGTQCSESKHPDTASLTSTARNLSTSTPARRPAVTPEDVGMTRTPIPRPACILQPALIPEPADIPPEVAILAQPESPPLSYLAATDDLNQEPYDSSADPNLPAAAPQPQPNEYFTRNPHGLTILASASSAKPGQPLRLHLESPAQGGGGVPQNPALAHRQLLNPHQLQIPQNASPRKPGREHPPKVVDPSTLSRCTPLRAIPSGNPPKGVVFARKTRDQSEFRSEFRRDFPGGH